MKPFCHQWRSIMLADIDQELDSRDQARLQAHLESCPACQGQYRLLSTAREATAPLRQARSQMSVPAGLAAAVNRQIADAARSGQAIEQPVRERSGIGSFLQPRIMRYATSVATIVLLVALVIVYRAVIMDPQGARTTAGVLTTTTAGVLAPGQPGVMAGGTEKNHDLTRGEDSASAPVSGFSADTRDTGGTAEATGSVTSANRASGATAATTAAGSAGVPAFRLYTGKLAELETLIGSDSAFRLQPDVLASAPSLRILTSPADASAPIRQAVILAGYPAKDAARMSENFSAALPEANGRVTIESIPPAVHARLAERFGDTLYAQLLPSETERQLTYIMITIGGQGLGQGKTPSN